MTNVEIKQFAESVFRNKFFNYSLRRFSKTYNFDPEKFKKHMLELATGEKTRSLIEIIVSMLGFHPADLLNLVKSDIVILVGDIDPIGTIGSAKKLSTIVPNSKVFKIPKTKHWIPIENPKDFIAAITQNLS